MFLVCLLSGSAFRGSFKLSIWVPSEAVGKVIGKKGSVIQHIQTKTNTTCSIVSTSTQSVASSAVDANGSRWAPIVITGEPASTMAAHEMIRDIVEGGLGK